MGLNLLLTAGFRAQIDDSQRWLWIRVDYLCWCGKVQWDKVWSDCSGCLSFMHAASREYKATNQISKIKTCWHHIAVFVVH